MKTASDMAQPLMDEIGLNKADALRAVALVFQQIAEPLQAGEGARFTRVGFGAFRVVKRAAGTRKNPRTGETIDVPESLAIRFKASPAIVPALPAPPPQPARAKPKATRQVANGAASMR